MSNTNEILCLVAEYSDMTTPEDQLAYIESLEAFIIKCRKAVNNADGYELYSDAVYDTAMEKLKAIKPDSELLSTTWSEDCSDLDADLDKHLMTNPMLSIQTVKSYDCKEFKAFEALLSNLKACDLHLSLKLNGHGIRVIYNNGTLVKAHSRGRSSNGRDLTRQMSLILPNTIPALVSLGVVELRGEVLLPFANLEAAKKFKPDIKSAFSGVSAMLRDSASDEECKLLHFVAYNIFIDNKTFATLTDKYEYIKSLGFIIPEYVTIGYNAQVGTLKAQLDAPMQALTDTAKNGAYYTDGVVASVNDISTLDTLGWEGTSKKANVALKVGFWAQNMYSGKIEQIVWKEGRSKKTPVAKIEPTLTATGATVTNVPLYAPLYILALEAYIGKYIHFRFGGEAGVVPCYPDGRLVTTEE